MFDESCLGTVPVAFISFIESTDFENAFRLAVSLGGDSDNLAAITGGIAEAYYREIPEDIVDFIQVIRGQGCGNSVFQKVWEEVNYV